MRRFSLLFDSDGYMVSKMNVMLCTIRRKPSDNPDNVLPISCHCALNLKCVQGQENVGFKRHLSY